MRTKAPSSPRKRVSLDQLRLYVGDGISRDGSPRTEQTFANITRKRTCEAGRPSLSSPLFRSGAARSIAVDAPGDVEIIPTVLGHGSPKAAERQYNLAGSREAARDHGRLIDDLREQHARRPRCRPASFR